MAVSDRCPECGARIRHGGSCRDNFNALLALEWDVPGGTGIAHFYAVSSYILQHPESMSYTAESLSWLRSSVTSALGGDVSTEDLLLRARRGGKGTSAHVTRRAGDTVPRWGVEKWKTTIEDVLAGGIDGYCARVEDWARAVIADLDASSS
jgi:hypothetical protein